METAAILRKAAGAHIAQSCQREVVTRKYDTRHPFVTERDSVYHVAGGRWVGGLVGWCVWVGVLCVCGDFELCLWLIVLCGKRSQVQSVGPMARGSRDGRQSACGRLVDADRTTSERQALNGASSMTVLIGTLLRVGLVAPDQW